MSEPIAGSTRSASNFFADIMGGISEGVSKIGSEILPNWAAQELLDQKQDMLYNPTNYTTPAVTTTPAVQTTEAKPVLFDFNKIGTQITAGSLLIIIGLGVGGYLLWKKFM